MAERPWITPDNVREYSENASVQNRTDTRLAVDIERAEQYILSATNNDFSDFPEIPSPIRTAAIIIAEAYASNAIAGSRLHKSETFDDYSYTDDTSILAIDDLDISSLLEPFIVEKPRTRVSVKLRRL